MFKKSSFWLVLLVSIIAIAFVVSGCAKKQVVKEEAASKPFVPEKKAEVKPPPPAPVPPKVEPKVEAAPKPAPPPPPPKVEAAPPAPSIDLASLRIWFAFDDYNLSNKAKENLEKIAAWMSKSPNSKILIEGNTCNIGTAEYNLALGQQRANSAKTYLEGLGITSSRLSTISYGFERPLMPNTNEANRSKNRRDEFVEQK